MADKYLNADGLSYTLGKIKTDFALKTGNYEGTYFGAYSAKVINTDTKINVVDIFNFTSTGGDTDVGTGKATFNNITGISVVKNQLVTNGDFESTDNWGSVNGTISASNNVLSYTITTIGSDLTSNRIAQSFSTLANHKYLVIVSVKAPYDTTIRTYIGGSFNVLGTATADTWTNLSLIVSTSNTNGNNYLYFDVYNQSSYQVDDVIQVKNYKKIDLTLWYGSDDRIPSDLTADEFLQMFGNMDLQTYDTGTLVHTTTTSLTSVGYNQFDGEWEITGYDVYGNINTTDTQFCTSVNYIEVIPSQTYTFEKGSYTSSSSGRFVVEFDRDKNFIQRISIGSFTSTNDTITLSANTRYVKIMCYIYGYDFTDNFPTDIAFHLTWTSSKTGYEEYYSNEYALPSDTLMGIYGVSGDVMENGTTTRKYGIVDLGTLTVYTIDTTKKLIIISSFDDTPYTSSNYIIANIVCSNYKADTLNNVYGGYTSVDKAIAISSAGAKIWINDSDFTGTTTTEAQEYLSGKYLVYELATETTETNDGFTTDIIVDDYGVLDFEGANGVPASIDIDYQPNLVDYLRRMYLAISDPDEVSERLTTLESDVSALETKVPTPPTTAGTYTLQVVVDSDGNPTYSWVSE